MQGPLEISNPDRACFFPGEVTLTTSMNYNWNEDKQTPLFATHTQQTLEKELY